MNIMYLAPGNKESGHKGFSKHCLFQKQSQSNPIPFEANTEPESERKQINLQITIKSKVFLTRVATGNSLWWMVQGQGWA